MPVRLPTCRDFAVASKPIYALCVPERSFVSNASKSEHWLMKPRSFMMFKKSDLYVAIFIFFFVGYSFSFVLCVRLVFHALYSNKYA